MARSAAVSPRFKACPTKDIRRGHYWQHPRLFRHWPDDKIKRMESNTQPADSEQGTGRTQRRLRDDVVFFSVALLIFVLDQATKSIIRHTLAVDESWPDPSWFVRITHVTNTGAAFGLLQGQALFLTITTILGVGAIVLYYLYPPFEHGVLRLAMGMLLGGALGNLTDRLHLGHVTDFIDFRFWPAFNVADSSITVGVTILILAYLLQEWRAPQPGKHHGTAADAEG